MVDNQKVINLKYHCYDWDDNILHMNTKIIMEKNIGDMWLETPVSTTEFASFRKDPLYRIPLNKDGSDNYIKAYSNFRDDVDDSIFLKDVIDAIDNNQFAPSYNAFKECLIKGELFFLITARGHEPNTIKRAIEYFIETQLTKQEKLIMKSNLLHYYKLFNQKIENINKVLENYLNLCEYIGVTSNHFKELVIKEKLISDTKNFNPSNTEISKKIAISYIVEKLHKYKLSDKYNIKIGFSDDDKLNVESIFNLFDKELKLERPETKFYIFDTSKNVDGTKNFKKISI